MQRGRGGATRKGHEAPPAVRFCEVGHQPVGGFRGLGSDPPAWVGSDPAAARTEAGLWLTAPGGARLNPLFIPDKLNKVGSALTESRSGGEGGGCAAIGGGGSCDPEKQKPYK